MSTREINATAASLLGFLHWGPMTGWELDRAVEDSISNFWNVTRSQVYRELRTLTQLGYVRRGKTGRRDATPYTITGPGKKAFAAWIKQDPGPPIIRIPMLVTIFFAEHLPPGRLSQIASRQREEHAQKLSEFKVALQQVEAQAPFVAEVIRVGIEYNELMIRTFDRLLSKAAGRRAGEGGGDGRRRKQRRGSARAGKRGADDD